MFVVYKGIVIPFSIIADYRALKSEYHAALVGVRQWNAYCRAAGEGLAPTTMNGRPVTDYRSKARNRAVKARAAMFAAKDRLRTLMRHGARI